MSENPVPPILLMIYNRPALTARVVEALRVVSPRRLYVAADGPRANDRQDQDRCAQARAAATATDWPCQVRTLMRDKHLSCRDAVSQAISWFFEHEEEGVILEDDCIAHPSFFAYCHALLARYSTDRRIMCITGNNFVPGVDCGSASYWFSIYNHCWGWATWRRAWELYDPNLDGLDDFLAVRGFSGCAQAPEVARRWEERFRTMRSGLLDNWSIAWTYSCWANSGLTCTPRANLVSNIGFGPDATHTQDTASSHANLPVSGLQCPLVHPGIVVPNTVLDLLVSEHRYSIPVGRKKGR